MFPPSSPDTRSRNQRVEPRTITQYNPPLSLSLSSSSSLPLYPLSMLFFLFFFSSSIFLSRGEKKAHVPRIKLRFDLIIGIEVSFEDRSIRIFRIFRAKLDMDILLWTISFIFFFFIWIVMENRPRKRRTFIEFRGPSIERTDDGLFLFPQFRRFGVRGVSCWSSVTYFFLCVCVYTYIYFFSREGKRERNWANFRWSRLGGICVATWTNIRQTEVVRKVYRKGFSISFRRINISLLNREFHVRFSKEERLIFARDINEMKRLLTLFL